MWALALSIFDGGGTRLNDSPLNLAKCQCIIIGQKLSAYIHAHIYQCHAHIVQCACNLLAFSDNVAMRKQNLLLGVIPHVPRCVFFS